MARYGKEHKEQTRRRIVETSGRRFKVDGVNASGIATLMADAGLTNGAFYAHFASKDDLVAGVVAEQLGGQREAIAALPADSGIEQIVRAYLSVEHRDHPGDGCPSAALLDEIGRCDDVVRRAYTDGLLGVIDVIAARLEPDDPSSARFRTLATFAGMVGTMQLARALTDRHLSDELLEQSRPPAPARKPEAWKRSAVEWLVVVVVAVAVALLISATSIQAFFIPSKSMESTLHVGDRVLVNKWSYRIHDVHRGDVVVFSRPKNEPATNVSDLIKRVIGLPGDTGHHRQQPRLHQRSAAQRALSGRRRGQRGRAGQVGLHPRGALQDPQGTALGHGRQPDRLRGQPLLRPDPRIVGGGPRLLPDLAAEPPGQLVERLPAGGSAA